MDREKQIKEMAELIYKETDLYNVDTAYDISTVLHDAGYRKSSEVAREIFEEIEKWRPITKLVINDIGEFDFDKYGEKFYWVSEAELAELKKKYTEDTE